MDYPAIQSAKSSSVVNGTSPPKSSPPSKSVADWMVDIQQAEKWFTDFWDEAKKAEKRYLDERASISSVETESHYNIFWSDIEILKPSTYSKTPKVDIKRRFNDSDPSGRVSSELLERSTQFQLSNYGFEPAHLYSRDDFLIIGRGQTWNEYEFKKGTLTQLIPVTQNPDATFTLPDGSAPSSPPSQQQDGSYAIEQPYEDIVDEWVCTRHIHYRDFLHQPARVWEEVMWGAKIIYLTKEEITQKFSSEIANKLNYDYSSVNMEEFKKDVPSTDRFKKAVIYEVWDKSTRTVIFLSKGFGDILKTTPDPLHLKNFFPFPKPVTATLTRSKFIPISDYRQTRDQLFQLDSITSRCTLISEMVRVAGVYDASIAQIQELINGRCQNVLKGVESWGAFIESGGIEGVMAFLPLKEITDALSTLFQIKSQIKLDYQEIRGTSDIVRGSTNPYETADAQNLKAQFQNLRLVEKQTAMQNFAKENVQIIAEIIAQNFQPESILRCSDAQLLSPDDQAIFQDAIKLIKDEPTRNYRIDIETDSTLAVDRSQDKQERNEFITAIGQFMSQMGALTQQSPDMAEVVSLMLLFVVRGYRVGRDLEGALEKMCEAAQQARIQAKQNPQPPPPDPKLIDVQQKGQIAQQKLQLKAQESQAKFSLTSQESQHQMQLDDALTKQEMAGKQQEMEIRALEAKLKTMETQQQLILSELTARNEREGQKIENVKNLQESQASFFNPQ